MIKLLGMLTRAERLQLPFVLGILMSMAVVEVVGVAAIAAFIALVTDPGAVESNRWIKWLHERFGAPPMTDFIVTAGIALAGVILLRNLYSGLCTWVRLRFLHHTRKAMATRLLQSYLAHPFAFFQSTNSATLSKNITSEVAQLINGYLLAILTIISDSAVAAALLGLTFWTNPVASAISIAVLGTCGGLYLLLTRRVLRRLGQDNRRHNEAVYKTAAEAIGGIKELKVLRRERYMTRVFYAVSERLANTFVNYQMLAEVPRLGLEVLVVGVILVMVFVVVRQTGDMAAVTATVALFVAAFYRLTPTVHRLVTGIAGLSFNRAILDDLSATMSRYRDDVARMESDAPPLPFARSIELENVGFRYEGRDRNALTAISLEIPRYGSVAFVGPTGVGKSTLADIIIGLLEPSEGRMLVDGTAVSAANARAWRANTGYVPQVIYIADDTICRNIALGIADDAIDMTRVVASAQAAHLDEFIRSLPEGYDTVIGERGIRLSGGQRQRIGIARALYNRAEVLVLDEATSSLDGITEAGIEEALRDLAGKVTVVIIAHRLTTVRRCDRIYVMDEGRIAASGTYDELIADNPTFRAMARMTA